MPFPNPATQFKPGPKQVELARKAGKKGGKVKSVRKRLGQQLRWMRERGLSEKASEHLRKIMLNPEYSLMDIYGQIQKLSAVAKDSKEKFMVTNTLMRWHELVHGSQKNKVEINNHFGANQIKIVVEDSTVEDKNYIDAEARMIEDGEE